MNLFLFSQESNVQKCKLKLNLEFLFHLIYMSVEAGRNWSSCRKPTQTCEGRRFTQKQTLRVSSRIHSQPRLNRLKEDSDEADGLVGFTHPARQDVTSSVCSSFCSLHGCVSTRWICWFVLAHQELKYVAAALLLRPSASRRYDMFAQFTFTHRCTGKWQTGSFQESPRKKRQKLSAVKWQVSGEKCRKCVTKIPQNTDCQGVEVFSVRAEELTTLPRVCGCRNNTSVGHREEQTEQISCCLLMHSQTTEMILKGIKCLRGSTAKVQTLVRSNKPRVDWTESSISGSWGRGCWEMFSFLCLFSV